MRPLLLLKAVHAARQGRLGDAAAYKAAALTAAPYPDTARKVGNLATPLPDLARLSADPVSPGSFGHACVSFARRHGIAPLSLSPAVRAEVGSLNLVAARYVLVHDAFHVLLGFGIDRPGELGVWSFVGAQRYSPSYERAAALATVLYPLVEPSAGPALRRRREQGLRLGNEVPCLLAQPIERHWHRPLQEARRRLGIHAVDDR